MEDEGTYKPDFSAHAGSERLRCVRISKASFDTITSMSKQEEQVPPSLKIEEANREDADGTIDGNRMGTSAADDSSGTKNGAKARAFSDEGAKQSISISPSNNRSSGGGGAGGAAAAGRITLSPSTIRRGVPSGASLKILKAAAGAAVVPSATTPTQNRQRDTPLEAQGKSPEREPGAGTDDVGSPPSTLEAGGVAGE